MMLRKVGFGMRFDKALGGQALAYSIGDRL